MPVPSSVSRLTSGLGDALDLHEEVGSPNRPFFFFLILFFIPFTITSITFIVLVPGIVYPVEAINFIE